MRIHNIRTSIKPGNTRIKIISGLLDDFELWFEIPAVYGHSHFADPFLAAALMIAMKKGEPIEVDREFPVSFKLLQGISLAQDLYLTWYSELQRVTINAEVTASKSSQAGFASFFSGGVDSLYTFFQKREFITHLIFLGGIDIQLDNSKLFVEALNNNSMFAHEHNKTLVPVVSNIRDLCFSNDLGWEKHFSGAGLASVALLLGFPFTLIPASQSHDMHYPDSTSPALDHLFSNEATTIYYDGGLNRPGKIKFLGQIPGSLSRLRVCWQDKGYNCGKCEKCVRTMLLLHLYNLECPTLPVFEGLKSLRGRRIESDAQKRITAGLIAAAQEVNDQRVYRFLIRYQRRESIKRRLAEIDRNLFSGFLKKLFFRLCKPK